MARILLYAFLFSLLFGCAGKSGYTTKVVKPRYRHWYFNHKKDKKAKRTKIVNMKS